MDDRHRPEPGRARPAERGWPPDELAQVRAWGMHDDPGLPPRLVVGNRYASAGLAFGLVGVIVAVDGEVPLVAWVCAVAGIGLSGTGFVKYCMRAATYRDAAVLGALFAWVALVILMAQASIALGVPMTDVP